MHRKISKRALLPAAILALAAVGCGDDTTSPVDSNEPIYAPEIPTAWASAVTNPFFPLTPGTTYEFEGETGEGTETVVVEVLSDEKTVQGVSATVVRDRVYLEGELIEDTYDWYAQDSEGNVWYLGEDSKEIEDGEIVSAEGSWEWGVDDALPGVIMWADPAAHMGAEYRQEYYEGEAEDWGEVVAVDRSITVPYGSLTGCIQTEDWNALESGSREVKTYAPGIGFVHEVHVDGGAAVALIEVTNP